MWTTGTAPNRLAALPDGRPGLLGGRLMRMMNAAQQREVLALVGDVRGRDVLEVGPGPGVLLRLLAGAGAAHVTGVDPSLVMRRLAVRALAGEIAAGRIEIRGGSAADLRLPDAGIDVAVSVNTVAIWPDLDAGLAELRRVLRPDGRLVLAWHGGTAPSRPQRRLVLPAEQLRRIEDALRARFATVATRSARRATVFVAHP